MNKKLKKTYLAMALASTLAFTGCSNCEHDHLDSELIKYANSDTIYDDFFNSIREKFFSQNNLFRYVQYNIDDVEIARIAYFDVIEKLNEPSIYRYSNSPTITNAISYAFVDDLLKVEHYEVSDEELASNVKTLGVNDYHIKFNNEENNFSLSLYWTEKPQRERIDQTVENECVKLEKSQVIDMSTYKPIKYKVSQHYHMNSNDSQESVLLHSQFEIHLIDWYDSKENPDKMRCRDFSSSLELINNDFKITVELDEEDSALLASVMTDSMETTVTIKEFLKNNKEIFVELFGESYYEFMNTYEVSKTKVFTPNKNFTPDK